jgi:outer membrane protein assembly factor BamB
MKSYVNFISLLFLLAGCGSLEFTSPQKKSDFFQVAWAKNLDPEYISGNLPVGLGAPRIFKDTVYMGSLNGVMHAL